MLTDTRFVSPARADACSAQSVGSPDPAQHATQHHPKNLPAGPRARPPLAELTYHPVPDIA